MLSVNPIERSGYRFTTPGSNGWAYGRSHPPQKHSRNITRKFERTWFSVRVLQ